MTSSIGVSWPGWRAPHSADVGIGAIEHPAQRQVDRPLAVIRACKLVERSHRVEVLLVPRHSELRILPAKVITAELRSRGHPSSQ